MSDRAESVFPDSQITLRLRPMREVEVVKLEICETGHLVRATPTGEYAQQLLHECGNWTWAKANYCVSCGQRLYPQGPLIP
jgi:hypothetical protein